MNVIALRRSLGSGDDGVETHAFDALSDLAHREDWLILACLLTDRTRRLVDQRTFAALKPGASLINVERGEAVVERDLIQDLQQGRRDGDWKSVGRGKRASVGVDQGGRRVTIKK